MSGDGDIRIGPYMGQLARGWEGAETVRELSRVCELVGLPSARALGGGRNLNVVIELPRGTLILPVAVKVFRRRSLLRDLADRVMGSKARRTWAAAEGLREAGVGTTPPIGFLERWEGGRLVEGYFLSEYVPDLFSFKHELIRLFRHDPRCAAFMTLLQTVADAVRRMHDAGFRHNDLGNQNILMQRFGDDAWRNVVFVDLNRMRRHAYMDERDRARDLSRIHLPSDLLRIFIEMYCDAVPAPGLLRWERFHRGHYRLHCLTRNWRHPRRARLLRREPESPDDTYPDERDMWIWDDRSEQPIAVLRPRDRGRYYPLRRQATLVGAALRTAWPALQESRRLLRDAFRSSVSLVGRVGVAAALREADAERELALLGGFGPIPVLVRFGHHEPPARWDFLVSMVHRLAATGHPVAVALTQDRAAARDPARWEAFVERVIAGCGRRVEWVEVGHAINRVKWGIWDLREYRALAAAAGRVAARHPGVRLMGPAAIDFEYHYVAAALRALPAGVRFAALSHHLYVDRRGAPENAQGRFTALDKFALARAVARVCGGCDDRLIISEVNWPLRGTGVHSPVNSPYESPGERLRDPSVGEDDYANYMIRYLLLALCSGIVERVYWWRLVARGFGLVDDTDPDQWRERPACHMLRAFLSLLGDARFVARTTDAAGVETFLFDRGERGRVALLYTPHGQATVLPPDGFRHCVDAFGRVEPLAATSDGRPAALCVGGRPVYLV